MQVLKVDDITVFSRHKLLATWLSKSSLYHLTKFLPGCLWTLVLSAMFIQCGEKLRITSVSHRRHSFSQPLCI